MVPDEFHMAPDEFLMVQYEILKVPDEPLMVLMSRRWFLMDPSVLVIRSAVTAVSRECEVDLRLT